jgi:transposase InsO family protein
MMVLREIVRRFGRLPRTIVVDGGKEFSSTYFESLLAFYGITKRERTGNPRGGSVVERLFDTSNTEFVHLVMGSTQLMKDVRSVSAEVQPKKLAIWTLPLAYKRLRYWAYEVYDTTVHRILGQSPRDAFNYGIERSGKRPHTLISYDDFKILSLPAPPGKGGKRKVRRREGVQVKYIDYWCDAFENPRLWGKEVPVRYDPFNLDTVYAFVDSEWHLCRSPLSYLLLYRTEKELQVATEIERQRRRIGQRVYTSMAQLAEFLELIDDDEKVLRERWRAMENAHVLSAINEEAPPREMDPLDVQRDDTTEHDPDVPTLYDYDDADVFPEY